MLEQLKNINKDLESLAIPSNIILDKLRVVDEDTRKASAYVDSSYIPFYYYLGKYVKPKNLLEIGVNLGFFTCAFFKSCRTVENYLAYQEDNDEFYSKRLMLGNIKDNHKNNFDFHYGKFNDTEFLEKIRAKKWDLAFINEEKFYDKYAFVLDTVWDNLSENGMLVMENVISLSASRDAFANFCKNKNSLIFKTRYGTGIVAKEEL